MKISKKNLVSLVKQNIQEMAMDFDPQDASRPHQSLQDKLQQGDTPLKKIPFPHTGREPDHNFQELLASDRYRQVVDKVRRYTHTTTPLRQDIQGMMPLMQMMGSAHNQITQIERAHRHELEELAVELVKKEFKLPEGSFQFDAKIIGMGEFDPDEFNRDEEEEENPDPVATEQNLFTELEKFNLEKAKRRLINTIVHGAAERGHYMYHLVEPQLRRITGSDNLIDLYGILMSVNDAQYWQISPEQITQAAPSSIAGEEKPTNQTDPPTIVARGINFPVLVHELIKGIMEAFATRGRSEDYEEVEDSEDTLEKETWDLLLGPAIWDKFRSRIPEDILLENETDIQNYLYMVIFELPARQFLVFMKEVLSGSPVGDAIMNEMAKGAKLLFNGEDYQHNIDKINKKLNLIEEDTTDEELVSFMSSLHLPPSNAIPDLTDEDSINRFLDSLNRES